MLQDGDRYVISAADTLYKLNNSNCSQGDSVNIQGSTVDRYRLINGQWYASDKYTLGNYSNTTYVCNVYNSASQFQYKQYYILPATIIVLCLFSVIYHWFLRLRG